MTENNHEHQWQKAYQQGVKAYRSNFKEDDNPYGVGEIMLRCAWAGGWHDERRGMA